MENELNKEDLEQLGLLIRTSKDILKTYIELAKLEVLNKKETEDYQRKLAKLEYYLNLEKTILTRLNPNKIFTLLEEVNKELACTDQTYGEIEIIVENKMKSLSLTRVSKQLKEHIIYIFSNATSLNKNDTTELEKMMKRALEGSAELVRNLENDKWLLLISLLEKETEGKDFDIQAKLTRSKYYFSYIIPYIEKNLIKNNFNPPEEIYFSADLTAGIYKISPTVLEFEKKDIGMQLSKENLNKLLHITNDEYNKKELEIIIRTNLIRTGFQILIEEDFELLKVCFMSMIEKLPKENGHEKIIEIIERTFETYKKDKTLIKKVALGN